jgi:hypothetical protein
MDLNQGCQELMIELLMPAMWIQEVNDYVR